MAKRIEFADGAASSTTPTIGNIEASNLIQYANDAAYEAGEAGSPTVGNIYYNTTVNNVKYYNGSAWIVVLDSSLTASNVANVAAGSIIATDVQAAINELDSDRQSNTSDIATNTAKVSADGSIDTHSDVDVTTVAPVSGQALVYDGTKFAPGNVAASGGGSGINYVINQDFESTSDDVTVTANITKALEVTNKLRGTQSLKITIDTLATTADYVEFDLNTFHDQDTDESKEVVISFDINSSNANYTNDDVEFVLRDVTNSVDIPISNDDDGLIKNVNGNLTFVGVAQTVAGVTAYRLRMNILVAPTTDSILYFDTIKVGPDTFGPSVNIGASVRGRSNGGTVITASTTNIDFTEVDDKQGLWNGSQFTARRSGIVRFKGSVQASATISNVLLYAYIDGVNNSLIQSSAATINTWVFNGSVYLNEGEVLSIRSGVGMTLAVATINHWIYLEEESQTGNLISTQEANHLAVSTSTNGVTPTGTITGTFSKATFGTIDSDDFSLYSGGVWTALRDGRVDVSAYVPMSHTSESGITAAIRVRNTTTSKDVRNHQFLPGASVNIYAHCSGTLEVSKGDTLEIQVSNNAAAGKVFQSDANFTIKYQEKFKTFGAYKVDELIESSSALIAFPITVDQYGDLTSIDLPLGEWDISVSAVTNNNGVMGASTNFEVGVSTNSGNDSGGLILGDNHVVNHLVSTVSTVKYCMSIPKFNVSPTSTTTYYLKAKKVSSITNLEIAYKISARRIK